MKPIRASDTRTRPFNFLSRRTQNPSQESVPPTRWNTYTAQLQIRVADLPHTVLSFSTGFSSASRNGGQHSDHDPSPDHVADFFDMWR